MASAFPPAPAANPGAIYGFNDSATMRIYYHEASVYTTQKFIDFGLTNKGFQFNNITVNRAGTPTANHDQSALELWTPVPPATPDSLVGHAGYVDGILGLNTKLTFPNLSTIAHRPDYISVLRATLIVRPAPGSYTTTWRLPPQLSLYSTDQNNEPSVPQVNPATGGLQTGNMTVDFLNPLNTFYSYDVTNFVKAQIINNAVTANQDGLLLAVPLPGATTQFLKGRCWPISQTRFYKE